MIYESRILAQSNVYLSNVDCTIFFIEESAGIEIQLSFYLALFNLYLIISEIITSYYILLKQLYCPMKHLLCPC